MSTAKSNVIPESQYATEFSDAWQQDVFCVVNSRGEKYYLHTANITIEGDEFASLAFRRQIRRGAQAVLPPGHVVVEGLNGVPSAQRDPELAEAVNADDYSLEI